MHLLCSCKRRSGFEMTKLFYACVITVSGLSATGYFSHYRDRDKTPVYFFIKSSNEQYKMKAGRV
jgi:hypothetical protein